MPLKAAAQEGRKRGPRGTLCAVPLRSRVPRTAAKCREYCPRDGQRFRGFSPLFADIRWSLTTSRGKSRVLRGLFHPV
jgi:hypothetical protein